MNQYKKLILVLIWSLLFVTESYSQETEPDVQSYELTIEPDIQKGSIEGTVVIHFEVPEGATSVVFNSGDLVVEEVKGSSVKSSNTKDSELIIQLFPQQEKEHEIIIAYHGNPKRGLLFDEDLNQAHTVYFTDHWMVCNNKPGDRATFSINLILPKGLESVASGTLTGIKKRGEKVIYKWNQVYETPSYTYGFAIGTFNKVTELADDVALHYYSSELDEIKLQKVFEETPDILDFLEEKSGIEYIQDSYSQVLIGNNYQEMSGLSVLSASYPGFVFKDSSEIHLTTHELAHQWWGNMITCETFGHFWLNEALAVYMSSAFNEHRFGKEKYDSDISIYKSIYDDLVKRGKDKPLVFGEWEPSRDNRNVIYYKGAYVLHLLRAELGDDNFWKGIKLYTQNNYGKSVVTNDFKLAMEQASNIDLSGFFDEWVY